MSKQRLIAWASVFALMALIFILSHQPAEVSHGMSSGITEKIMDLLERAVPATGIDIDSLHTFVRKNAHFFAYLILGLLTNYALVASGVKSAKGAVITFGLALFYAISDETHQLFIPGRSGEVRDVFIDSSGAAVGIGIYFLMKKTQQLKNLSARPSRAQQANE